MLYCTVSGPLVVNSSDDDEGDDKCSNGGDGYESSSSTIDEPHPLMMSSPLPENEMDNNCNTNSNLIGNTDNLTSKLINENLNNLIGNTGSTSSNSNLNNLNCNINSLSSPLTSSSLSSGNNPKLSGGFNFGSLFPGIELSDIQVISEQLENTKVAIGQQRINPSTLESGNLLVSGSGQLSPLSALQASLLSGNVNMAAIAAAIAAASSTATASTPTTTTTSSNSLSTALNQLSSLASPVAVASTATSTPTTPTLTSSMGQQQQMALLQTVFKQVS